MAERESAGNGSIITASGTGTGAVAAEGATHQINDPRIVNAAAAAAVAAIATITAGAAKTARTAGAGGVAADVATGQG